MLPSNDNHRLVWAWDRIAAVLLSMATVALIILMVWRPWG